MNAKDLQAAKAAAAMFGRIGGVKRWAGYSAAERSAHARAVNAKRWGKATKAERKRNTRAANLAWKAKAVARRKGKG
jgi:hypothetical protein